jgi:hypothetical protein
VHCTTSISILHIHTHARTLHRIDLYLAHSHPHPHTYTHTHVPCTASISISHSCWYDSLCTLMECVCVTKATMSILGHLEGAFACNNVSHFTLVHRSGIHSIGLVIHYTHTAHTHTLHRTHQSPRYTGADICASRRMLNELRAASSLSTFIAVWIPGGTHTKL